MFAYTQYRDIAVYLEYRYRLCKVGQARLDQQVKMIFLHWLGESPIPG